MRRLNLDIFSDSKAEGVEPEQQAPDPLPTAIMNPHETSTPVESISETRASGMGKESPRFVPVGFYTRHLRLLDEAVLRLRRKNHWQASKSAILRSLIELHANELEQIWLDTKQ
jgi:hypothetical protein